MGTLGSEWGLDTKSNTYTCLCKGRCSGGGSGGGGGNGIYCIDYIDVDGIIINECYANCIDLHNATGAGPFWGESGGSCYSHESGGDCCEGYLTTDYGFYVGTELIRTCQYICAWNYCGSIDTSSQYCGWNTLHNF